MYNYELLKKQIMQVTNYEPGSTKQIGTQSLANI